MILWKPRNRSLMHFRIGRWFTRVYGGRWFRWKWTVAMRLCQLRRVHRTLLSGNSRRSSENVRQGKRFRKVILVPRIRQREINKRGMLFVPLSDPIPHLGLGFDSICFGSCFVTALFVLSSNDCFGFWVSVLILVWLWVLFGFFFFFCFSHLLRIGWFSL